MLDTKSKSRYRQGILAMLAVLCLCSVGMLSTYRLIAEDMEQLSSRQNVTAETYYSFSKDLCQGIYFLYNEYSKETDKADILNEYTESKYLLLSKYMDCALLNEEGETLVYHMPATRIQNLTSESTSYAFRAKFVFQADGALEDITVDGVDVDAKTQYYAERTYLDEANATADSYWSDISTPQSVEVIYGMTEENLEEYMSASQTDGLITVYGTLGHTRLPAFITTFGIFAGAAALLLPFHKKFDIGNASIFRAPLEFCLLFLAVLGGVLVYYPSAVVYATINGGLPKIVPGVNSPLNQALSVFINFAAWFIFYAVVYWIVTCLRAVFTMKKAYFTERTLTAKVLCWAKQGSSSGGRNLKNIIARICRGIKAFVAKQYDALVHLDFQEKTNRIILKIVGINFIILALICCLWFFGIIGVLIYSILLFFFLHRYFRDIQKKYAMLLKATNQLAGGDLDTPIEGDAGVFNPVRDELKKIQAGFKEAVEKEVKSERMKTELVTNVSHDLKTPLTAIITYTDLLKQEQDEEKRKEYIDVLERKSLRLKMLIEDLFEISKAASKNVIMHYMKVDIVNLLKQVGLENDEKIRAANLEFRWKLPEHKIILCLDSQKTYRIFENLIVNITKYAMPHTRVYIEMTETESHVRIHMKNVSAAELDFNADEITDRFVRGDSSRNTEGSGLGLAIAKSFTELQHGELKISTEADLFKAEITFPKENGE